MGQIFAENIFGDNNFLWIPFLSADHKNDAAKHTTGETLTGHKVRNFQQF